MAASASNAQNSSSDQRMAATDQATQARGNKNTFVGSGAVSVGESGKLNSAGTTDLSGSKDATITTGGVALQGAKDVSVTTADPTVVANSLAAVQNLGTTLTGTLSDIVTNQTNANAASQVAAQAAAADQTAQQNKTLQAVLGNESDTINSIVQGQNDSLSSFIQSVTQMQGIQATGGGTDLLHVALYLGLGLIVVVGLYFLSRK